MAERNHPAREPAERGLVITRVFDAPRDLVFKAWTEPERVMRWWGPNGFTTPFCASERDMCQQGWAESFGRLAESLAKA